MAWSSSGRTVGSQPINRGSIPRQAISKVSG